MKSKYLSLCIGATALLSLQGCDDLLDRDPQNKLTDKVVYNNYESIKAYAWQLYDAFPAYDQINSGSGNSDHDKLDATRTTVQLRRGMRDQIMWADFESDLMDQGNDNGESSWIWQRYDIPTSAYDYSAPYKNIRAINSMLAGIETSAMSAQEKEHWKSVGYFFRAYNHASLLNRYGDIIYVNTLLTDNSPELYGERMPRDQVAQNILDELLYARDNLGNYNDGECTLTRDAINAFISRFGLMEGTWRKYHGLGEANKYLEASVTASEELLPKYRLHPNYDEVFNSESLSGVDGIILYKKYVEQIFMHRLGTETRNDNAGEDLTKKAIDMYLMTDGQTRWTSPLFEGDRDIYAEFRNRDKRFYYTITPPYKVKKDPNDPKGYLPTGNPADEEYINLMKTLSDDSHKTLPSDQWTGTKTVIQPNLFLNKTQNWNHSGTGYRCWKFYNRLVVGKNNRDINDAPIFRIGEVMLNYAEAMYELGRFDQTVCNKTINKLRERGGIPTLVIGNEPEDPTRDPEVSATLWEIRRERAIELMAEGFRFDDLRRWKKCGDYLKEQKLGMWIKKADYPKMPIQNGADEGYIALDGTPPGFPDHYYLQPIPTNELILNENLKQNPGWEKE